MKKEKKDFNQLAKSIVDKLTGSEEVKEEVIDSSKNPAAVALGKLGGKKGGAARAAKLTPERRSEIARTAAGKRWKKN